MAATSRNLLNEVQFLFILVSMAMIAVVVAVSLFIISSTMLSELKSRAIATADEMEAFLEHPLYIVDDAQAVRIAETFLSSGKISGIDLTSTASGILLSNKSGRDSRKIQRISRNISRNGLPLGSITLTFSDDEIIRTRWHFGIISFVIVIAVLLINFAANRYVIAPRVRRPFNAIFSAIRNISGGDYRTRIDPTPYRDVNFLISLFNDMADKIHLNNQSQIEIETALRQSEERYRQITRCVPDVIWSIDLSGRFTYVNSAVERTHGWTAEEWLKLSVEEVVTAQQGIKDASFIEAGLEQITAHQYDRNRIHTYESEELRKDGSTFRAEVSAAFLWSDDDQPSGIIGITRDITERKRSEEEKDQLQLQLMQAQKMESVGRLAGGVAHDFNNMLSGILGHTEMAMMRCTPSEPVHPHLKVIEETVLRSADLVRQLLAFARKQTVAPKVLDINKTVAGMLKMLRRLIGEDLDLAWMPGTDPWMIRMDPSQVDQLLMNLCVNARDAISGIGKVTIETENIAFDAAYCALHPGSVPGEYLLLAVSDDGAGMDKAVLDHLFEPFFTTKEMGKGTGLGLATVYGIVKQNNGYINVYSEPGSGTTFRIYLPRFQGEAPASTAPDAAKTPTGFGEMVLVVEDDPVILNVSQEMLAQLGYRVLTAATPGEAILQAEAGGGQLQLLITDVVMPEMNGRDLSELIRDIQPGIKCLFVSGYTANVIAHRGVLDEGVFFLPKPFSLHELASKVREVLEAETN